MLVECFNKHLGRIAFTVIKAFQYVCRNGLAILFQFPMDLEDFCTYRFKVMVQLHVLPVFPDGTFLLGIPFFNFNTTLNLDFSSLAIDRDAHTDGSFPVFEEL